jgi:Rps23 Pro-64 3,4-dihydroxylase Tpa1-like proline 4-hydroxylase
VQFYLDPRSLRQIAARQRVGYAAAEPFPHVVLDGVLPEEMLDLALEQFPGAESRVWREFDDSHAAKLETQGEERLGPSISWLLYQLNSAPFLRFLEELTGIQGLIGDPYFTGGGLHLIERGGRLGIHTDFTRHYTLPLYRRLNVLIFLNRDWDDAWGGHLELWDRDVTHCVRRVAPVYNRMVVFTIGSATFHGHPDRLESPPGVSRKSIALYYFTATPPDDERAAATKATFFVDRPGVDVPEGVADRAGPKADRFVARRARAVRIVQRLTPPILFDAIRNAKRRHA